MCDAFDALGVTFCKERNEIQIDIERWVLLKPSHNLFLFLPITVISISCIKPQRLLCLCGISVREEL